MQCTKAQRMRLTSSISQMRSRHQDGTLVVVDMQTFFVKGCLNPRLVANVMKEVLRAKRKGWAIVLLECEPWRNGDTITPVAQLLEGSSNYARTRRKSKDAEDGSEEVIETCRENGFSLTNFRVVGVYSDCCVEQTAVSLVEKLEGAFVRVVKRACSTDFEEKTGWEVFRKRARLKVA
jgi:nicotinamidase-related amidase